MATFEAKLYHLSGALHAPRWIRTDIAQGLFPRPFRPPFEPAFCLSLRGLERVPRHFVERRLPPRRCPLYLTVLR